MLNPALLGQPGTTIALTPTDIDDDGKPWPNTTLIPADSSFAEFWNNWLCGIKHQAFSEGVTAAFQQLDEHPVVDGVLRDDTVVVNPYA